MKDKRPEPKPRKLALLWQSYLWWHQLMEMKKGSDLRVKAVQRGKSNYSAHFERQMVKQLYIKELLREARKVMVGHGEDAGPIWGWLTSIKGLRAGGEAAKLLGQIDDIGLFATVSKLWAFAGWAVDDEGGVQRLKKGTVAPYNRDLKAVCWRIVGEFVMHNTPDYREMFDAYKEKDRRNHPNVICQNCGSIFAPNIKRCPGCKRTNENYNLLYCDAHIDARARRKLAKLFLSHVWLKWREFEGLPISDPYVQAVLGHTNIIPPPQAA